MNSNSSSSMSMLMSSNQKPNENIKKSLLINFFKLMSKFSHLYYDIIHEWDDYPSINDIKDNDNSSSNTALATYIKKANLSINIILKKAIEADHKHIVRVLLFTQSLLSSPDLKSNITKLNLLTNNSITLLKFLSSSKTQEEVNAVLFNYLSTIIKTFNLAYQNTYASLYEIIANNLALYNKTKTFFDYEQFFMKEDEYLSNSVIPEIRKEVKKLNESCEEGIVEYFDLSDKSIDYSFDLDLLYIINVLFELKDLLKYKAIYSIEEYNEYKAKIQRKLFEDRKGKAMEYQKEKKKKEKDKEGLISK